MDWKWFKVPKVVKIMNKKKIPSFTAIFKWKIFRGRDDTPRINYLSSLATCLNICPLNIIKKGQFCLKVDRERGDNGLLIITFSYSLA